MNNSVTVITSTIGRPELQKCIDSVLAQTVKCRHLIFVNGMGRWLKANEILMARRFEVDAGNIDFQFLRNETGDYGAGGSMQDVYAAGSFLAQTPWICWLDDDNWFEPNHVESLLNLCNENDLKWAYSLRRFVAQDGTPICDDDWDSLGHFPCVFDEPEDHLIDNSCYFVRRDVATLWAPAWCQKPIIADRIFANSLLGAGIPHGCTGLSTVNYRIGGTFKISPDQYLKAHDRAKEKFDNGFPWRSEKVWK